jgi:hypothetical protein
MVTSEYAMGLIAAVAFAVVLYKVVTSGQVSAESAGHRGAGPQCAVLNAGAGTGDVPGPGFVTAEAAVVLPVLVMFTMALVWALMVVAAQIQCVDAARAGARAAARQDPPGAVWRWPVTRRRAARRSPSREGDLVPYGSRSRNHRGLTGCPRPDARGRGPGRGDGGGG